MRVCALYCVSTAIRRTPELTQFESVKSMLRKWPANGIAGLHCHRVSSPSRVPLPPANTSANVSRVSSLSVLVFIAGRGPQELFLSFASRGCGLRRRYRWRGEFTSLLQKPFPQGRNLRKAGVILWAHEVVSEPMRHDVLARQHDPSCLHFAGRERP